MAATDKERMLRTIEEEASLTGNLTGRPTLDPRVMEAFARVPRADFVPAGRRREAWANRPIPIGEDQTISQPFMVALMTDLIDPQPHHTVLEVGTGSGYQAAILSVLVRQVYSLEIIASLATSAAERLERLGYANVAIRHGSGADGWPEHAPFDGIVVTAAAAEIPPALVAQLKPGGRMVIPVGRPFASQRLLLVEKDASGATTSRTILGVAFVPLTGDLR